MLPDPLPEKMGIKGKSAEGPADSHQDSRRSKMDVNVALRRAYDTTVKEEIPDSLMSLLEKLN